MAQRGEKKHLEKLKRQKRLMDRAKRLAIRDRQTVSTDSVLALATSGRLDQALLEAERLTESQPTAWQAWNLLATLQDHLRDFERAEQSFQQVTALAPERPEGWHGLGRTWIARQSPAKALENLQHAARLASEDVRVLRDLAKTQLLLGNVPAALKSIGLARELAPDCPDTLNMAGMVAQQTGDMESAASAYIAALELRPDFVDALANLGECLRGMGQLEQAGLFLQRARSLDPNHANTLGFSGMLATMLGQRSQAIEWLQRAIELNPRYRLFRLQLARCQAADGKLVEAQSQLSDLIERFGENPEVWFEQAGIHAMLSEHDRSHELLAQILVHDPKNLLARLRKTLLVPPIPRDVAEIQDCRDRVESGLDQLLSESPPALEFPLDDFANAHFYLSYHGLNNRTINSKISSLFRRVVPTSNFTNPRIADLRRLQHPGSRIRVAFLSKNFTNHTIGRLNLGLVQALDRSRFEVSTFVFSGSEDSFQAKFRESSDHFHVLPRDFDMASQRLAADQPDVLYFADIGMDPTTYHLAHTRLAPIQCTTWGHPITTGISTIDYFLSAEDMDSEASQAHYTEKLVVLRHLLLYYDRPALLSEEIDKSLLGLSDRVRLYLCPQTLFKMHPEFDEILAGILDRDPDALLLMIKLGHPTWQRLLQARWERTMPQTSRRILWLERMSAMKFQHLFRLGDVALDPYHFGSGNTCLEALGMGMPLVTLPDEYMRTRMALACYRRMGISEMVTDSPEQYVDRAVSIAQDPDYRRCLSRDISERSEVLFNNLRAVRELEGWLESVVALHADRQ